MGTHGQATERDQAIDLLRWLATVGVIIQHSPFASRYSPATIEHLTTLRHLFGWCVLFFFMASGYVVRVDVPWYLQVRRRALRLLPPYVVVSLISFVMFTIAVKLHLTSVGDVFGVRSLLVGLLTLQGFGPQLYFLPYLLVISLATLALVQRAGVRGAFLVMGGLAALQWLIAGFPGDSIGPKPDRVLLYALANLGGIAMQRRAEVSARLLVIAAAIVTAGGLALTAGGLGAEPLVQLVVPFWLWWFLRRVPLPGRARGFPGAAGTGAVYLWHSPILLPGFTILLGEVGLTNLPNFMVASLLTVLVCLGIDRFARAAHLERVLTL